MESTRMNLYRCAACRRWIDADRARPGRWIETAPLLREGDSLFLHLCPRCCDDLDAIGEAPVGYWVSGGDEDYEEDERHAG